MAKNVGEDEWCRLHHADALRFLREALIHAVQPHLTQLDREGHLTLDEIRDELITLYAALPALIELVSTHEEDGS